MSCCSLEICTDLSMYLQGNRQCFLLSKTHTPNGRLVFKNFLFISQTTTNCLGTKNAAYYRNWNNQNFKYTHVAIFTQNADMPGTPKNAWGILLKLVDLCGKKWNGRALQMPQIDSELGLLRLTKEGGVRKKQELLIPLSLAKVLAHVFLLASVVFLEMFHVTLFTYPFKHICFLLTYWLNCSCCFHPSQKNYLLVDILQPSSWCLLSVNLGKLVIKTVSAVLSSDYHVS